MKKILANLLVLSVAITPTISLVNCKMVREENKKIIEDELPSLPSNFTITQGDIYPSFGINKEEGSQNYFFNPISDQLRTLFLNIPQRKIAPLGFEKDLATINDFRMYLEYPFAATFKIVSDRELSLDKDQMVSVTLSVKCLKITEKWSVGGVWKMKFTDMNVEQKITFKIPIIPNENDELNKFIVEKYNEYIVQNNIEIDKNKLDFNNLNNIANVNYLEEKAKSFITKFINNNPGLDKKINIKKITPPKGEDIKALNEPANSLVKINTIFNLTLNIEGLGYLPKLNLGVAIRYKIM